MLLHGDELGRTQRGNNNVYAQDNELSWVDWERARDFEVLSDFTARLARLRQAHPVFRRRRHFQGRVLKGSTIEDIGWFTPAGEEMTEEDWDSGFAKSVSVFLNGEGIREPDSRGEPIVDESFFLLFNGHHEPIEFTLPEKKYGLEWTVELDTATDGELPEKPLLPQTELTAEARSVIVLRCPREAVE
jgi:glycogen operon protein